MCRSKYHNKGGSPIGTHGIVISDYDSQWPGSFEVEKTRLLKFIGEWVLDIQHIGSTAVTGLGAKPIIDIMISVNLLREADAYCISSIVGLGYEYVKEYEKQMPFRRFFLKKDAQDIQAFHIHLVEKGGEFWERHLLFRDYLRANPDVAREYEQLKRSLAPRFNNGDDYAKAKTGFIKTVESKAMEWRKSQA